ncbi:MAG: AMP-binding protein [Ilumatobacteraceae bacterium]
MSITDKLRSGSAIARSVLAPIERPDRLPRAALAMAPWGSSAAALLAGAAARYPDRVAVIDDEGTITYRALWRRTLAVAAALQARGVGPGSRVGLLARNHHGFIEMVGAVAATGADLVLLNTGFAGPQLADVVAHEGVQVVVHDDEFASVVASCGAALLVDEGALAEFGRAGRVGPPPSTGSIIILTSGTTGRPKGTARSGDVGGIEGVGAVLDRIPLRLGDTQVIAAPLFHAWGFSHLLLGLSRCTTNVVGRRFDAESTLQSLHEHRADVLVVVPVMLARLVALSDESFRSSSTPQLRVIASSGSAIGSALVVHTLDRFGPVLYNLYGSTEVAVASIARPADLRAHPDTAGRPALGVRVEILDSAGEPVPPGNVGRVFVGGSMRFDGYTNGDDKERVRGMVSSGDMGHVRDGLLFIEGRDDDMIVSGGENVFPHEVEELLAAHPGVADVAVVGVPDDEFGQALMAFVVRAPRRRPTEQQLRRHVRDQLARHKVPRSIRFVDELPRNTTGKVLRSRLLDQV